MRTSQLISAALLATACVRQEAPASASASVQASAVVSPGAPAPAPVTTAGSASTAILAAQAFVDSGLRGERLAIPRCVRHERISCGTVSVVSAFTIDSVLVRGDTARVAAHYRETGTLVQHDSTIRYQSRDSLLPPRVDTMLVVRGAGGWRVARADTVQRVQPTFASLYFDLDDDSRDRLAADAHIDLRSSTWPVLTPPAALTQLPQSIRDSLVARGCGVLQERAKPTRNVERGNFFGTGGGDWMVLCALVRKPTEGVILVFPRDGGAPADLEPLGKIIDAGRLPNVDPQEPFPYGCATGAYRVAASFLAEQVARGEYLREASTDSLTAAERATPAHDGIGSGDCEGVSNIYYWTGKRWVRFPGGD